MDVAQSPRSSTLPSENAGRLRTWARLAVAVAAAGSLGLVLLACSRQNSPPVLMLIMGAWVFAPLAALELASTFSSRWTQRTRAMLHTVMIVISVLSLVIYVDDVVNRRAVRAAFVYVIVPAASWLLMGIAIPAAAWTSRAIKSHSSVR